MSAEDGYYDFTGDFSAQDARDYDSNFKHLLGLTPTMVQFDNGEMIELDKMTDEQAHRVARALLQIEMAAKPEGTILQ